MNTHQQRRQKLAQKMKPNSIFVLHSGTLTHKTHDEFYPFYPSMNAVYLTGIVQDEVILMMVKEDTTVREFLFIEETTDYMRKWLGEKLSKDTAGLLSGIDKKMIAWIPQFQTVFHNTMNSSRRADFTIPKILYLDMFSPKETMKICQTLYEGGYITYMRTDKAIYFAPLVKASASCKVNAPA